MWPIYPRSRTFFCVSCFADSGCDLRGCRSAPLVCRRLHVVCLMGSVPLGLSVPFIRGRPLWARCACAAGERTKDGDTRTQSTHQRRGHTGSKRPRHTGAERAQRGRPRPTLEGQSTGAQFGGDSSRVLHRRHGTANGGWERARGNRKGAEASGWGYN
jgi:hypothetical protein